MFRKLAAEFFGTFWLVFGGCGSAVLAAKFGDANLGIAFAGVSQTKARIQRIMTQVNSGWPD